MAQVLAIYNDFIDLDFSDYAETLEADLSFIASLVDAIGETDARKFLAYYFE